jgi:hypothetical protein
MTKLLVAGILGTMLALTTVTPANAFDRFGAVRTGARYVGRGRSYADRGHFDRYAAVNHGYGDRFGCDRYPARVYHEGYAAPRLTYGYGYRW